MMGCDGSERAPSGGRLLRACWVGCVGLGLGLSACGGAPAPAAPVEPWQDASRGDRTGAREMEEPTSGSSPERQGTTASPAAPDEAVIPKSPTSPSPSAAPHHPARVAEESALRRQFGSGKPVGTLRGKATYYHDSLAGNRTANGERYAPEGFTAAHRSLPFGTILRVKKASGGPDVYVRVTDRGPFGRRRIILDLSRAAAERIGLVRAGVAEVIVEVMCRERSEGKRSQGKRRCALRPAGR